MVLKASEFNDLIERTERQRNSLKVGDHWFLISMKWWHSFLEKIQRPNGVVRNLPKLSNESLLNRTNRGYVLKPNLIEKVHFMVVSDYMLSNIDRHIGIENKKRDQIMRTVVQGDLPYGHYIDVYPDDQIQSKNANHGFKRTYESNDDSSESSDDDDDFTGPSHKRLEAAPKTVPPPTKRVRNAEPVVTLKDRLQYLLTPQANQGETSDANGNEGCSRDDVENGSEGRKRKIAAKKN